MPAPFRPMIAMNNPIPTVIPYFKFAGTSFTSFSRKLTSDNTMKIIPSNKTAASAIFHGSFMPFSASSPQTVKAK